MPECNACGDPDRSECGCAQQCEDCHQPVGLIDETEWPETGKIRCWGCQHKRIERLESELWRLVSVVGEEDTESIESVLTN